MLWARHEDQSRKEKDPPLRRLWDFTANIACNLYVFATFQRDLRITDLSLTDLGLAFANVTTDREFHVLLILFIMLLTILFCHSFVRLFMIALKPPHGHIPRRRIPSRMDGSGYAQPDEPIPVFLARDEEITGGSDMDNAAKRGIIATPPPAYGVWKSTVVCPNCVHARSNLESS